MDLNLLKNYLKHRYHHNRVIELDDSKIQIIPMTFTEQPRNKELTELSHLVPYGTQYCMVPDMSIAENKRFDYPVFIAGDNREHEECIILLHGLNERNWDKYLPWAKTLCQQTGKAILLFPIAFHINRTPSSWASARENFPWVAMRKEQYPTLQNSTFVNVALSMRLSDAPLRIYTSGRETLLNLWQLMRQIRAGKHPLLTAGCKINFFAYSIGAMAAQVLMLANPGNLVADSRFFLFCGGSIFEKMNGSAREIMDQVAWEKVRSYYVDNYGLADGFRTDRLLLNKDDKFCKAFTAMLRADIDPAYRFRFYEHASDRLRIMTLRKDSVMPTEGVIEALGEPLAHTILTELDFPFEYTHQNPFPCENKKIDSKAVNDAFESVFNAAAEFLG